MPPALTPAVSTALSLLVAGTTLNKSTLRAALGAITNDDAGRAIREAKAQFAAKSRDASAHTNTPDGAPHAHPANPAIMAAVDREIAKIRTEEQRRCDHLVQIERDATTAALNDVAALREENAHLEAERRSLKKELKDFRARLRRATAEVAELKQTSSTLAVLDRLVTSAGANLPIAADASAAR